MSKFVLFAVGLLASAPALAQAPQPSVRSNVMQQLNQNFDKGDVNNDGFLSRAEIQSMTGKALQGLQPRIESEFKALDKDGNGQVSLAEFRAAAIAKLGQSPEVTLQRFDSNKDGKVSAAEFRAPILSAFDRADLNKDGKVTPEEARKATGRP